MRFIIILNNRAKYYLNNIFYGSTSYKSILIIKTVFRNKVRAVSAVSFFYLDNKKDSFPN